MGRFSGHYRFKRIHDDPTPSDLPPINEADWRNNIRHQNGGAKFTGQTGGSLKAKVLRRVFSEDYERAKNQILDPRGQTIIYWNKIFFVASLLSLFIDPLFFYLPIVRGEVCVDISKTQRGILTILRSVADIFYLMQIYVRFHTAYIAPSSRVVGRGELVIDHSKIARRYLRGGFWLDLMVALPLPQVLIWGVSPNFEGWAVMHSENVLWLSIIIFQYLPRVFLVFPLSSQLFDAAGAVTQTAWAGAAFNLLLFMLAGHVSGACWYLLSIERQEDCWHNTCNAEKPYCPNGYFDCRHVGDPTRIAWFNSTNVTTLCNGSNTNPFAFGIYGPAATLSVTSSAFMNKYFYCLWWGLKNISTIAQNLVTSIHVGENIFATIVATMGLALFALLIGNMQRVLQSTTKRLEEWRVKRNDSELWMHYRKLPPSLKQSVRKHDQYKWLTTKGVDEEALLRSFPSDLHRKIKRHLCFELVQKVPLFDEMDETTLETICERLKPALCTKDVFLLREGDPVHEMLFIIRGRLDSFTTNGGRTGFFNSCRIGPGDFCGEELLTWAMEPRPSVIFPSSTRTVRAITEVEAFALKPEDVKFMASQFARLHGKQLKHKFRYYSYQWRTWAACFIQAAWRRHKKLKTKARDPGLLSLGVEKPTDPNFSTE